MTIGSWLASMAALGAAVAGAGVTAAPAASASGQVLHPTVVAKVTSDKWAGYAALADRKKNLRYVAADFSVGQPSVCRDDPPLKIVATQWVALDGDSSGVPERIGVEEFCDNSDERSYLAIFSGKSRSGGFLGCLEVHGDTCPDGIDGGDRIQLSVYYNGRSYRLILRDVTKGISRQVYERCWRCRPKSAEVLSTATSTSTSPPLAEVASASFYAVRVTSADGKRGTVAPQSRYWRTAEILQLDSAGDIVGQPGPLLRNGRGFSTTSFALTG
jgi:hypothetical protein